ncbi:MAG: hypothetical protein EP335_03395 [Alphaproteobacteria bacterium]|nr:MAG: hypothetical protein EP335_03395 [Alphaproteobacteria bacterium]
MYTEEQQTRRLFGSDNTMGLFVALYLILLAFFIVLTSVSNQAVVRAAAAMQSVNKTFARDGQTDVPEVRPSDSDTAAQDTVLSSVQRSFLSEFEIEGRFLRSGGNVFEVQFPQDYLFAKGSFQVRSDMGPFLDQLVAAVRSAPPENRQEVAFLFGAGAGPVSREMTRSQEFAVRRAGALARYLREQGMPSGTFSAGFAAIPEGDVVAVFRSSLNRDETMKFSQQGTDQDAPATAPQGGEGAGV